MKKQLLLIVCLFGGLTFLSAQSTLTSNSFNFQPDDSIISIFFSDSVITPGPAGANQTWDFSFLQETMRDTATIKAASTSPQAAFFPNATIAGLNFTASIDSGNVDVFFESTPTEFVYYGISSQITVNGMTNIQNTVYTDPEIILSYPMAFTDSVADDFYGEFGSPGFMFARKGSNYRKYDGYGTLMMPNGATYTDIIRIKLVQVYKDSSLNPALPFNTDYESENVYYFIPGGQLPILQYNKFTVTTAVNPAQTTHFIKAYTGNSTVGIENFLDPEALSLAPNPSKDQTELSIQSLAVEYLQVSILNIAGQEVAHVFQGQSLASSTQIPIQTNELVPGFYIVKVSLGEKIGFVKMQVE